jgi:hypothetical protein
VPLYDTTEIHAAQAVAFALKLWEFQISNISRRNPTLSWKRQHRNGYNEGKDTAELYQASQIQANHEICEQGTHFPLTAYWSALQLARGFIVLGGFHAWRGSRNFPLENAAAIGGLLALFIFLPLAKSWKWWPDPESNHRHGDFQSDWPTCEDR